MLAHPAATPRSRASRRRPGSLVLLALLGVAGTAAGPATIPEAAPPRPLAHPGVPSGLPAAAHVPEPALAEPAGWPDLGDRSPRTSGTGRYWDGAFLWSDFIYDDYGASGLPAQRNPTLNTAPAGSYGYTDPAAANNGADVFRVGVALDGTDTVWRVDWNTLADPCVPAVMFALTPPPTAVEVTSSEWPAGAAVRSPAEVFLFVSCDGAWLRRSGTEVPVADLGGDHHVDQDARSFIVRLPDDVLDLQGTWMLQVGAGLRDGSGRAFAQLGPLQGALPGGANLYDLGLVPAESEDRPANYWMEAGQAAALSRGDLGDLGAPLDWDALRRGERTPEPMPTGYSNRWYVSSLDLGDGYVADPLNAVQPRFLGQVQPYGIYVPVASDLDRPMPVTFHPHGGTANHNFWTAGRLGTERQPMLEQVCEQRGAICVFPLGRSPWGWWNGPSEVDFLEVLNRVLSLYDADLDRLSLAGLSMGGWGAYKFALTYPDVFASALVMAAPSACGGSLTAVGEQPLPPYGELVYRDDVDRRCVDAIDERGSGDTAPLVENARWTPFYISHGPDDPAVPVTVAVDQARRFADAGYRYTFDLRVGRAHALYATDPDLSTMAAFLDGWERATDPAHVTVAWYPNAVDPDLGTGTHRAWWVSDLVGVSGPPSAVSRVDAFAAPRSLVQGEPYRNERVAEGELGPIHLTEQRWRPDTEPGRRTAGSRLELDLSRVASVAVDLARAGLAGPGSIDVETDHAVSLVLRRIGADVVSVVGPVASTAVVGPSREVAMQLPAGSHRIELAAPTSASPDADGESAPRRRPVTDPERSRAAAHHDEPSRTTASPEPLPVTGGGLAVPAGLVALLLGFRLRSAREERPLEQHRS